MSNILFIQKMNWADEIDLKGFMLWTKEEWEEHLQYIKDEFEFPHYAYVGTNQNIRFDTLEEWLDTLEIKEITEEETNIIKRLFGKNDYLDIFGNFDLIEP